MHFNVFAKFAALAILLSNAGPAAAAPAESSAAFRGKATFVTSWWEAGLTRYRFNFEGVDGNYFVHAFQNCGGITNNWQSWTENGHGVFDNSEVVGFAGARVISCGIYAVTGQDCHAISEIGC